MSSGRRFDIIHVSSKIILSMITISKPQPNDAEGINEVIKLSWYATYVTPEIGITKEDIDLMYAQSEKKRIEVFRHRAEYTKDGDISFVAKENDVVVDLSVLYFLMIM